MGATTMFDKALKGVCGTDYRMDITIDNVVLVSTEYKGAEEVLIGIDAENNATNFTHIPIKGKVDLDRAYNPYSPSWINTPTAIITIGVKASVKPPTGGMAIDDLYREFELRLPMSEEDYKASSLCEQAGLLDGIVADEMELIKQVVEDGLVFEGERIWMNYAPNMMLLNHPRYREKMASKLPRDLGYKILEKTREVEWPEQLKQNP